MEFRFALKSLRGELGISQTDLANSLHVNIATISRWELGKTKPTKSIVSVLLNYAKTRGISKSCYKNLKQSLTIASKQNLDFAKDNSINIEYASLGQLIDDALFPIYICDYKTYDLLYVNRKAEEMFGESFKKLLGTKCYKKLMHRDSPCEFCRKNELVANKFVSFDTFMFDEKTFHRVQGKLIHWNGTKAQVRYITDTVGSLNVSSDREREATYRELLRIRYENANDAIAIAHYNLTNSTISDLKCDIPELKKIFCYRTLDYIITSLCENSYTDDGKILLDNIKTREALISQFYSGKTHICVKHSISCLDGYFESIIDLMQNPVTYDIEALAVLRDITDSAMAEDIINRLFAVDYETIATIDSKTGEAHPYIGDHIDKVINVQKQYNNNVYGIEMFLRNYCADDDLESVIEATSLRRVKRELESNDYYDTTYSLKEDGKVIYKRAVFTYLDTRHSIIVCAMQNLTKVHSARKKQRDKISDAITILQEQCGMNVARYDISTKTFYSNSNLCLQVGLDEVAENMPDAFLEKNLIESSYTEDFRDFFNKINNGQSTNIVLSCKVKDGSYHKMKICSQILYNSKNNPYQAILSFFDMEKDIK